MLIAMVLLLHNFTMRGQAGGPPAEWNASINFNANAPQHEDAWAFDGVQVPDGRFVIVGYAELNPFTDPSKKLVEHSEDDRRPGYSLLDEDGKLLKTRYFGDKKESLPALEFRKGIFTKVVKLVRPNAVFDGVLLLGFQLYKVSPNIVERQILVVRLDNALNEVWTSRFHPQPTGWTDSKGTSIDATWNGTDYDVAISGDGVTGNNDATFFGTYNFNPNNSPVLPVLAPNSTVDTDDRGRVGDCLTMPNGDTYFTGRRFVQTNVISAYNIKNSDGGTPTDFPRDDYEIMVGFKPKSGNATLVTFQEGDFTGLKSCPNVAGPCTPGQSNAAWHNCGSGSDAIDFMGTDFDVEPLALTEDGESILRIGDNVYVLVSVRSLDMTAGFYQKWQFDGDGVKLKGACLNGDDFTYGDYKDADVYLMKFNADLSTHSSIYVGHFSGGDFHGAITEDKINGGIVIGGTTADKGICGLGSAGALTDVDLAGGVAEANMLIKVDISSGMNVVWQQHFAGQGKGNCTFGLVQTNDGGFLIIGNNDLDDGVTDIGETFNIIKYGPDVKCNLPQGSVQVGDITVSGNKTWDQVIGSNVTETFVTGKVTILNGATLTIDNEIIHFALGKAKLTTKSPGGFSGIDVAPGGKLIVKNGSTLIGTCGRMWDGIMARSISLPSAPKKATVSISSGSTVEDAVRGAIAGSLKYETKEVKTTLPNGSIGILAIPFLKEGGIGGAAITVTGSTTSKCTFRNCGMAIVWNVPGATLSNTAKISNTVFECTKPLADQYYLPTFGIGQPKGTEVFCVVKGMTGLVSFTNCVFGNTAGFGHQLYNGVGIYAMQSNLSVTSDGTNANFKDLYIGLEAAGGPSGVTNHVTAKKLIFDGCYQGMNLRNTLGSTVFDCDFLHIPPSLTITGPGQAIPCGLYCDGSQGVKCAENLFKSNYPNLYQSGAIFVNSTSGAEVYRNRFDNLSSFATGFLGDNLQLGARCNKYEEDGTSQGPDAGWLVTGKLANQGSGTGSNDEQPDNRYWPNCNQLGELDIYNAGQSFDYFEKHPSVPGVVECVVNVNVQYDLTGQNIGPGNCPFKQFLIGEDGGLLSEYQNSGNALPERNRLLNAYLATDVDETASIPDPGATNALNLLIGRNQESDKRLLAESYLGLEDYSNSQTRYQQISGSDEATQHLKSVLATLITAGNAGRNVFNLNQSDWASLTGLLNADDLGGSWVRSIDFIRNGKYHPLSVAVPTYGRSSRFGTDGKTSPGTAFPNPFNSSVEFTSVEDIAEIQVFDFAGRMMWKSSGAAMTNVWTPDNRVPDGIYYYTVRTASGQKLNGSIAFIRQ